MVAPVLEKAPTLVMKSAWAIIPSVVPRMVDRSMDREAFVRMSRCWLHPGHSLRMWLLDSRVSLSHGQEVGSVDNGRKERRNSPV